MKDSDRFKLLFGPYKTPRCRLGKKLFCERWGWVPVTRISDARISWPQTTKKGGKPALILCGDLVKAVRRESVIAVSYWWGVSRTTVWEWRTALGVAQVNQGTERLYRDYAPERLTPEVIRKAHAAACTPEANAKKAAYRRGKPAPPNALAALDAYRHKKPSEETRRKMSEAHRRRVRPWTDEEDALLGAMFDHEVARRTGRTLHAVETRRELLSITALHYTGQPWSAEEDALLGTMADHEVARRIGRTLYAVITRRTLLGITALKFARRR